jgi:type II secretory pathway component PulF
MRSGIALATEALRALLSSAGISLQNTSDAACKLMPHRYYRRKLSSRTKDSNAGLNLEMELRQNTFQTSW